MGSAARNVFDIERPLLCTGSKRNARKDPEKGQMSTVNARAATEGRPYKGATRYITCGVFRRVALRGHPILVLINSSLELRETAPYH